MPIFGFCGEEAEAVYGCTKCGVLFCAECGDPKRGICAFCEEASRGADLELIRLARWFPPPEFIDPDFLEEIRQGADPYSRAREMARYIGHHSRKEEDMR